MGCGPPGIGGPRLFYCGAEGGAAVVCDPVPNCPLELSMTNGVSGFMLSISFSTGMVDFAAGGMLSGVLASGVCIAMPEFGGRNFSGNFNSGVAVSPGIGATISGVTITISSVLVLVRCIDWKNFPRIGIS